MLTPTTSPATSINGWSGRARLEPAVLVEDVVGRQGLLAVDVLDRGPSRQIAAELCRCPSSPRSGKPTITTHAAGGRGATRSICAAAVVEEPLLQHQVLGRVAAHRELAEHGDVGAVGVRAPHRRRGSRRCSARAHRRRGSAGRGRRAPASTLPSAPTVDGGPSTERTREPRRAPSFTTVRARPARSRTVHASAEQTVFVISRATT